MKTITTSILILLAITVTTTLQAQEIRTLFGRPHTSGGYGAVSNKFTTINGKYANLAEFYGGWYVNHRFLIGIEGAALTSNLRVPEQYSINPGIDMSYQYGQFGLMTEYVLWSNRSVHFVVNMVSGVGFTVQYERYGRNQWDTPSTYTGDENWFVVAEPGAQLELNLLKWLRFSPGISYRKVWGSDATGLNDAGLSSVSYNATIKIGKF